MNQGTGCVSCTPAQEPGTVGKMILLADLIADANQMAEGIERALYGPENETACGVTVAAPPNEPAVEPWLLKNRDDLNRLCNTLKYIRDRLTQ